MAIRQDQVQLKIDFITDESRSLAKTLLQTKEYNDAIESSRAKIQSYHAQLHAGKKTEEQSLEIKKKIADEEAHIATNLRKVLDEGKKVEKLDFSKVTPAQLVERARQLGIAMRQIPQSAPEFKELQAELIAVNTQLKIVNNTAKGIAVENGNGGLFGRILGVAGGVGLFELAKNAIRSVRDFGKAAVAEVDSQLKADAQIKEAIRSTAGVAGKSLEELKGQAEQLQEITLFSDDQTEGAQALLLTFTNIRGEIFDNTIPLVQDLSTAFNQDLSSSAIQVGKALNDPIKGVTALQRVGITFSAEQKKMIKSLVETGDVAGAQKIILGELERQVGGSAAAAAKAGDTFKLLQNQFAEIKEVVGLLILNGLKTFQSTIQSITSAIKDLISVPFSQELRSQQTEFNILIGVLQDTNTKESERAAIIKTLKAEYPQYLQFVGDDAKGQIDLAKTLEFGNSLFEKRILLQATEEERTKLVKERIKVENDLTKALQDRERSKGVNVARGGSIRNEAGDLARTENVAVQAETRVQRLRNQLDEINTDLKDLTNTANETALRTAGKSIAALEAEINGLFKGKPTSQGGGGGGDRDTKGVKAEAEAAAGSLAFLRKQIADLQEEIEKAPGEAKVLAPLLAKLKEAERALKGLEAKIAELNNPTGDNAPTLDQINAEFGGAPKPKPKGFSDSELESIIEFNDARVEDEQITIDEITALKDDEEKKDITRRELALSAAKSLSDAYFQIKQNQLARETAAALTALDNEYGNRIAAAEGNNGEQERLQKELEVRKAKIEREAARKRKDLAIKEAIVAGALAVISALKTGPLAAIAAGIAAAAQVAIIASQKFARGGYTGRGSGARDSSGYRPAGIVHEGEYVAPKWQVESPETGPVVQWLENRRLRGYAAGGLVTLNTTPSSIPAGVTNSASSSPDIARLNSVVEQLSAVVANFPRESKARVVITELETEQSRLDNVRDAASI